MMPTKTVAVPLRNSLRLRAYKLKKQLNWVIWLWDSSMLTVDRAALPSDLPAVTEQLPVVAMADDGDGRMLFEQCI